MMYACTHTCTVSLLKCYDHLLLYSIYSIFLFYTVLVSFTLVGRRGAEQSLAQAQGVMRVYDPCWEREMVRGIDEFCGLACKRSGLSWTKQLEVGASGADWGGNTYSRQDGRCQNAEAQAGKRFEKAKVHRGRTAENPFQHGGG